jgi:O-antigen/teichoic acid export membrane protein
MWKCVRGVGNCCGRYIYWDVEIMVFLSAKRIFDSLSIKFGWSDLGKKVAEGGAWLSFGGSFEQVLRLVRNMVLSRVLLPNAFGSMALVLSITMLFESLSEIGVKQAVVQSPDGNKDLYLNGVWFFALLRGAALAAFGVLFAPLIAQFYKSPELTELLRLAFIGLLVRGVFSPRAYVGLKHLEYKRWILVENLGGALGVGVSIFLSILLKNAMGLVIGFLSESIFRVLLSYVFFPFVPRLKFERGYIEAFAKYARRFLGTPILTYLFLQADVFVIGRILGEAELGSYALAASIARIPDLIMQKVANPLMVPAFSIIQNENAKIVASLEKILSVVFFLGFPIGMLCIFHGPIIMEIVFTPQNRIAGKAFGFLALTSVIRNLGVPFVSICYATNRAQIVRLVMGLRTIVFAALIIPATQNWGISGTAGAMLITVFLMYFVQMLALRRMGFITLRKALSVTYRGVALSTIPFAVWGISLLLPGMGELFKFGVSAVALLSGFLFLGIRGIKLRAAPNNT